jgi:uncharacterized protein (DUF1800 family)
MRSTQAGVNVVPVIYPIVRVNQFPTSAFYIQAARCRAGNLLVKIAAVIATNRFGLGARPGELSRIDENPSTWLLDQLQGPSRQPEVLRGLPGTAAILVEVQALRKKRRDAKRAAVDEPSPDVVKKFGSIVRHHYLQQTEARFKLAAATDYPFHERLVHFWSNHFAVSADKQPVSAMAGAFENEAIRPNLNGSFYDLLVSVEQHPAMILYLDNQRSIGPGSALAKRANRHSRNGQQFGLNENLAREILELHTLGVDGGYTQRDVTTFAKVITGWSIGGAGERGRFAEGTPGTFEFRDNIHEPGSQTVLGQRYRQSGLAQGEAVMRNLATHDATACHLSRKLVQHFVADEPPAAMVDRIATVFRNSGGDLPSVHAALVNSPEPWQQTFSKYKTPQDFVISAFRAFNRVPENGKRVVAALDLMGQTPFRPGSPAGWPDTAAHWGGADALYKRIEWSSAVARIAGSRVNPLQLGEAVLGPAMGDHTRTGISRAESAQQGLTLFLVSPEFQRR